MCVCVCVHLGVGYQRGGQVSERQGCWQDTAACKTEAGSLFQAATAGAPRLQSCNACGTRGSAEVHGTLLFPSPPEGSAPIKEHRQIHGSLGKGDERAETLHASLTR